MKTRSIALRAYHAEEVNTPAWCWKVTSRDGLVLGFTSVDIDLIVGGLTYEASTGFSPSQIEGKSDMSVPNLEVAGVLDSASLTEADLIAGIWDGATVEIFEVNYRDLSMGVMHLGGGTLGSVRAGRVQFMAELRGLLQKLQQAFGRMFTQGCPAVLGDAECKVNLVPFTFASTVTSAASSRVFTDTARTQAADYFGAGLVRWLTGANAGLSMEVLSFATGGIFTLALPMQRVVAVGDTFDAVVGCRKRFIEDCQTKFNNVLNFRGHPYVPGNDKVLGNAGLVSL